MTPRGGPKRKLIAELHEILAMRDMPLYPDAAKDAGVCYTDFLTGAHSHKFATDPKTGENYIYTPGRNRQCSIGWHAECTDPNGEKCGCPCHQIEALIERALEQPSAKRRKR